MPDNEIIPIDQLLPAKIPIIPLMGKPIFPGIFTPIMVGNGDDVGTVDEAMQADGIVGLVMIKNDFEKPTSQDLHQVGTVAKIVKRINLPDGSVNIFISTLKRFQDKEVSHETEPHRGGGGIPRGGNRAMRTRSRPLTRALLSEMKQVSENNPLFSEEMRLNMINIDHPGKIADFIASILNIDKNEQQKILEHASTSGTAWSGFSSSSRGSRSFSRSRSGSSARSTRRIEKSQRDYFLKEELKAIKGELGMPTDAKSSDYQRFKEKTRGVRLHRARSRSSSSRSSRNST